MSSISCFLMNKTPRQHIVTIKASKNNWPLSFWTSIPRKSKCDNIAPVIVPRARIAPYNEVLGLKSNIPDINSTIPDPILPQGSIPKVEKMCTLTGAAVNLK